MELPQRKLHRLKNWDYSSNGYYFVTICTKNKQKLLAQIRNSETEPEIILTETGKFAAQCWERAADIYPYITIDYYCIMPNHIHGIIIIEAPENTAATHLEQVIHAFKSITTRHYNKTSPADYKNQLWQLSYYDEIIRNERMLYDIRKYIQGNPSKWLEDDLYIP